jgi:hypothetical protein
MQLGFMSVDLLPRRRGVDDQVGRVVPAVAELLDDLVSRIRARLSGQEEVDRHVLRGRTRGGTARHDQQRPADRDQPTMTQHELSKTLQMDLQGSRSTLVTGRDETMSGGWLSPWFLPCGVMTSHGCRTHR